MLLFFPSQRNLRESDASVRICVICSLHKRVILSDLCCGLKHGHLISPLNSARNLIWVSAKSLPEILLGFQLKFESSSLDHHLQRGRPQNFGRTQLSLSTAWLIPWKVFLIHWHLFAALNLSLHCWEKAAPWIELNPALRWDCSQRNGNSQCSPVIQKSPLLPGR